jgi:hypothetical protein
VGQLVDRSEDISAVLHWDDGSRLAGGDITDDLLPLHLHVSGCNEEEWATFKVSRQVLWFAAIQA